MGIQITPEGTVTGITPEDGREFSLPELYKYTECDCIDIRRLVDGRWLVCDDNGKLKQLSFNPAATILYNQGRRDYDFDPIVGTIVIADPWEIT